MTYYTDPLVTLLHGDCIEVMATLPADSVDAVVTDPPYGLEFMGKEWDGANGFRRSLNPNDVGRDDVFGRSSKRAPEYRAGVAFGQWCLEWGREALRVTKPGGYLLAFGGTRTHHRLVCALEDAGWIIRDELDWIYASGFPKGKANLKPAHEPIVLARKPGPLRPLAIDESRIPSEAHDPGRDGEATASTRYTDNGGTNIAAMPGPRGGDVLGRWPSNVLLSDPELFDEPNPYVVGSGATTGGGDFSQTGWRDGGDGNGVTLGLAGAKNAPDNYGDSGGYARFFIVPKADRAERERGLAERPVQRTGTGALRAEQGGEYVDFEHPAPEGIGAWLRRQRESKGMTRRSVAAFFPSRTGGLTGCVTNWEEEYNRPTPDQWHTLREVIGFDDRYDEAMTSVRSVAHAVRGEEVKVSVRANVHPTVKPIDLMRHLVRLVTPSGGVVLDPFLGSGTTCLAASELGVRSIGIELGADYLAIAKDRLMATPMGLGLENA